MRARQGYRLNKNFRATTLTSSSEERCVHASYHLAQSRGRTDHGSTDLSLIIATDLREIPSKLSFDSKRSYQMITEARFPQQNSNWAYTHAAFVLSAKNEYLEGKGIVTLVGMPYLRSLKIHT